MLVTANVFGPLIDVFESVLKFFHNSGGISWGLSIVLLTIAVRAVLIPLTFRQIKSMVRMQGLSPQMKEIQAKYKDDKQRQQQEIMKFYKANNVNPLGSCLPLVLQLPVFVSLYYMLKKNLRFDICPGRQTAFREAYARQHHISLAAAHSQTTSCGTHAAGAHFLFIHDLTAKATGIELGILIVLYVGSQLGSSLLMSAATMDPTQRKVMLFMPLVFVLFVIRFPAGLLLYWITTNLWTVVQQYTVRRYIGPTVAVVPTGAGSSSSKSSGGGALTGSTGNGSGGGGGGLGARMRDRLSAAQSAGAEGRAEKTRALKSNGNGDVSSGSGSSGKDVTPSAKGSSATRGRSGNGTQHGDGSNSAATGSSKASSGRRRRGASSPNGGGSGNGDGSTNGGSGSGARAGAPPPRPPRKKKKRSGRRR